MDVCDLPLTNGHSRTKSENAANQPGQPPRFHERAMDVVMNEVSVTIKEAPDRDPCQNFKRDICRQGKWEYQSRWAHDTQRNLACVRRVSKQAQKSGVSSFKHRHHRASRRAPA